MGSGNSTQNGGDNGCVVRHKLLLLGAGGYTGYRVIKGGKKSKKKKKYL